MRLPLKQQRCVWHSTWSRMKCFMVVTFLVSAVLSARSHSSLRLAPSSKSIRRRFWGFLVPVDRVPSMWRSGSFFVDPTKPTRLSHRPESRYRSSVGIDFLNRGLILAYWAGVAILSVGSHSVAARAIGSDWGALVRSVTAMAGPGTAALLRDFVANHPS